MSDILIRKKGRAGRITLNRPHSLNALTHQMILAMEKALLYWENDVEVEIVIIDAVGGRAFCAGGDIQQLYAYGKAKNFSKTQEFWRDEYRLISLIANYSKPYIAVMSGFVMGGGVGVSAHGSFRIVTETSQIAMPECAIGLVPDVGASQLLATAPGHTGEYLGLTGAHMDAADAIFAGFADYYIKSECITKLLSELEKSADISLIIADSKLPPNSNLEAMFQTIDIAFQARSVEKIQTLLTNNASHISTSMLTALKRGSPLSLACTLKIIRDLRKNPTIENALQLEYLFSSRCVEHGEFIEGVRAAIIDKERDPVWKLTTQSDVDKMLQPLQKDELNLHRARAQ